MNMERERELKLEMLNELISTRRIISEEILMVRKEINELETRMERAERFKETEIQTKPVIYEKDLLSEMLPSNEIQEEKNETIILNEIIEPPTFESDIEIPMTIDFDFEKLPKVEPEQKIPQAVIDDAKEKEKKKSVRKDKGFKTISQTAMMILKEKGVPMNVADLKKEVEERRDITIPKSSWYQMVYKMKKELPKVKDAGYGHLQYMGL